MSWTPWKKVADRLNWYTDHMMRIPVCYELALSNPKDPEAFHVIYAAAAASEHNEIESYGAGEPAISARLQAEMDTGLEVFYRCEGAPDLPAAEALLAKARAAGQHPWNGSLT